MWSLWNFSTLGIAIMKRIRNLYFHGDRTQKRVALTFDDGPAEETEELLKILKKEKVKATFFILGKRILEREKIIRRMIKDGHELGNHSYNHKRLWFKSLRTIGEDIQRCDGELWKKFKIKKSMHHHTLKCVV